MPRALAQTMVEYGVLSALVAKITALQYRIESYIGTGNTKYVLIAAGVVLLLTLVRRRRRW